LPYVTPSFAPAGWRRSRPAWRWPGTHAGWHIDYCEPNNPSMNSAIVEEGSVAGGDGRVSYAARRRNLACRPPALAGPHGAHESLPHDGA